MCYITYQNARKVYAAVNSKSLIIASRVLIAIWIFITVVGLVGASVSTELSLPLIIVSINLFGQCAIYDLLVRLYVREFTSSGRSDREQTEEAGDK